ncbi:MAG: type II toxin-antitoxin system RelE/ParE family toxin [Saprospiraceae bacterium]|nr:type II toxin-antitoxin system RelE/ParE family toxin [Saprospiraceae bacterium]MBP8212368.1 type II toxin-antitoxin system RelE/ParE family toxin [Saprospiraceae bacterium]
MKVEFKTSFLSDLRKVNNQKIVLLVKEIIDELKKVKNLKKLSGFDNAFRIRVRNYRIGIFVVDQTIVLVRILNRKDIYKYFPK